MSAPNIISFMPSEKNLDFWIQNNLNVLFHGKHGVGKTSMIADAFKRNNIKFVMFSAATMDPWVDFIGVPKEVTDEKGPYLELVKPKSFRDDEVEALVFDEFNRSHKKVRNAVMELIQFKSINGKKFPNLKMVWAAINPENNEEAAYDVEKLDPAQADRFHVHIEIPYKPHLPFFISKYGNDIAHAAVDWWTGLPDTMKFNVSPRRLEMAIQMFKVGGKLHEVLPPSSNTEKLLHSLQNGSPIRDFKKLLLANDETKLKDWLSAENNYNAVVKEIIKSPDGCLHLLSEEKVCSLVNKNKKVEDFFFKNSHVFLETIKQLASHAENKNIRHRASNTLKQLNVNIPTANFKYGNIASNVAKNASKQAKYFKWNAGIVNLTWGVLSPALRGYKTHSSIAECVKAAQDRGENTYERITVALSLVRIISQHATNTIRPSIPLNKLSSTDIETMLQLFDWIANRTQNNTLINKVKNLQPAINYCITTFRASVPNFTVVDFAQRYPNIAGKLMTDARLPALYWAICP